MPEHSAGSRQQGLVTVQRQGGHSGTTVIVAYLYVFNHDETAAVHSVARLVRPQSDGVWDVLHTNRTNFASALFSPCSWPKGTVAGKERRWVLVQITAYCGPRVLLPTDLPLVATQLFIGGRETARWNPPDVSTVSMMGFSALGSTSRSPLWLMRRRLRKSQKQSGGDAHGWP